MDIYIQNGDCPQKGCLATICGGEKAAAGAVRRLGYWAAPKPFSRPGHPLLKKTRLFYSDD